MAVRWLKLCEYCELYELWYRLTRRIPVGTFDDTVDTCDINWQKALELLEQQLQWGLPELHLTFELCFENQFVRPLRAATGLVTIQLCGLGQGICAQVLDALCAVPTLRHLGLYFQDPGVAIDVEALISALAALRDQLFSLDLYRGWAPQGGFTEDLKQRILAVLPPALKSLRLPSLLKLSAAEVLWLLKRPLALCSCTLERGLSDDLERALNMLDQLYHKFKARPGSPDSVTGNIAFWLGFELCNRR